MPTASITRVQAAMRSRWGSRISDLGTHNCRQKRSRSGETIGGWSQHAWGNAWDIRVPAGLRGEINAFLDRNGNVAGYIDYGDGQYHIDGAPRQSGTPPCAGGDDSSDDGAADVITIPRDDETAGVPGGDIDELTDDELTELREAREDRDDRSMLEKASDFVGLLGDEQTWARVLLVVGGLVALIAGGAILLRDLLPTGRLAGAVGGAVKGATS